ncbi:MAG: hypothetical protein RL256_141, partial [Actinomycetota bacterium]
MSASKLQPGTLRRALAERIVIADGAMGTMIQASNPTLEEFQGHEGCNEILNVTRPDLIKEIHRKYLKAGVDAVETNTFGANLANLGEYGIPERIYELAFAGAKVAREAADEFGPDKWVLGSMGPGTKLPTLGHVTYEELRETYYEAAKGLIDGGSDGLLIETTQDLLQAKAAVNGARKAIEGAQRDIILIAQVTVETTGTMLLGSEIGAALNSLSNLGVDLIGMNCATGPAEMSEHLRQLSQTSKVGISCMPNAGLPILKDGGAYYPLEPNDFAEALSNYVDQYGLNLIGGCCGTTPEHLGALVDKVRGRALPRITPKLEAGASSLYQFVPFRQDQTYLAIGERANANGSKAFREALLAEDWEACIEIAKDQIRDGAHMLDLSVDYVGRDGVADMSELASRLATSSTLPIVIDSTEPPVLKAGLERLGGRSVINSVNYEDGDGPNSRFAKIMPLVKEHGAAVIALTIDEEGQARSSEWKLRVAKRLISDLVGNWGMSVGDIIIDTLTFPIATGQEETRRDAVETIEAIRQLKLEFPEVQTTLGVSNVSFGLNPAARIVLNSVFLAECVKVGLDSAIVHPSKISPMNRIPEEQLKVALDLIYDRRTFDGDVCTYDPLTRFLELFEGVAVTSSKRSRAEELAALPIRERLARRIIDGEKQGLESDLQEAMATGIAPLSIINDHLLEGMKIVGELFGKGEMQLPFVLQSAEVMKLAVSLLEPHMEKSDSQDRGAILLATVKGDVHDIGKNIVTVVLQCNNFEVVNMGVMVPCDQILKKAKEENADIVGLSGLITPSLEEMTYVAQEMQRDAYFRDRKTPLLIGGATTSRVHTAVKIAPHYEGPVVYVPDASRSVSVAASLLSDEGAKKFVQDLLADYERIRHQHANRKSTPLISLQSARANCEQIDWVNTQPSKPKFIGRRVFKNYSLAEIAKFIDWTPFFQTWDLAGKFPAILDDEVVGVEARRVYQDAQAMLEKLIKGQWLQADAIIGLFPANSVGDDILFYADEERSQPFLVWHNLRQQAERPVVDGVMRPNRCLADYVASKDSGVRDYAGCFAVTTGHG